MLLVRQAQLGQLTWEPFAEHQKVCTSSEGLSGARQMESTVGAWGVKDEGEKASQATYSLIHSS